MITAVLLPGMDGTGKLFDPFIAATKSLFDPRVVRYPSAEQLDFQQLVAIARTAIPADRPFVLLGESFSGPVAIAIAASQPGNLKGLILCCSFACNPRPLLAGFRSVLTAPLFPRPPMFLLDRYLLGRHSTPELRSALARAISLVPLPTLRSRLRLALSVDVSARLSSVQVPTLYLRGSYDRVVPPAASELIVRMNKRARVVQLEAPHFLLQAAPNEAAEAIDAFMAEIANT